MVKDLMPTSTSGGFAYVGHPMDVSGTLFFGAQEGGGDGELWKSDGTTAGTLVLKHFGQTQAFSEPSLVGSIGRTLLFVADDGVSGGELWRSDGTESGTEIVRDIAPGQASSMPLGSGAGTERGPYYLLGMLVGDELYFDAFNASLGFELWKSDGTTDGTQVVKDIFPGPKSSASTGSMLTQAGGKVYFAAQTRPHAWGLWTSDGTETGTQLLVSPSTDATWLNATAVGGVAFVVDELRSGGSSLWKTDGTRRGTLMVKNFRGKASVAWYSPVEVGPRLLFAASDGLHGWEPWSSDGTQSPPFSTEAMRRFGKRSKSRSKTSVDRKSWIARSMWKSFTFGPEKPSNDEPKPSCT
jgi:ELWxxDGT repeat protein